MTPTRWRVLVSIAAILGVVSWGGLRVLERQSPDTLSGAWLAVPWTLPVALLFVAAGIGAAALSLRSRLSGRPGVRPVDPLFAARMAALSKAASHVGAGLFGIYAGVVVFLLPGRESELRNERMWLALSTAVASALLVAAGLLLERVCRVKPPKDEQALPPTP